MVVATLGLTMLVFGFVVHSAFRPRLGLQTGLVFDEDEYDAGDLKAGAEVTHVFTLSNQLDRPVTISNLRTKCGCTTVPKLVGQTVEPGGRLEVPVTLSAGTHDGSLIGDVVLYIRDEPDAVPAAKKLRVAGVVRADYLVGPTFIDLGEVRPGDTPTATIRLVPLLKPDCRIIRVESSDGRFQTRLVDAADGREVEVRFHPGNNPAAGTAAAALRVVTDSSNAGTTDVHVECRVRGLCGCRPSAVVVGSDEPGPIKRAVVMTTLWPARLKSARPSVNSITVNTDGENRTAMRHDLVVSLPSAADAPLVSANLNLVFEFTEGPAAGEAAAVSVPIHRLPTQP